MYGDFFLVERPDARVQRATRLPFGETLGRDEAWLRDILFHNPEALPIGDLDASFGPIRPLCRELGTVAGRIDLAFINPAGRITLVECKLWRNPEARRKVVAQILDYARAITRWSYSDLQRQVCAATGRKGNIPFEIAREIAPDLEESRFIDAVMRNLRSGRFLLLIAGDGIREDVSAMAEMINRNAALGFSFGLVEVALYGIDGQDGALVVQPRIVAKTHSIEREVVVLRGVGSDEYLGPAPEADEIRAQPDLRPPSTIETLIEATTVADSERRGESQRQSEYRRWWQPVLDMRFDDPDQEPPKLFYPNNVRAELPCQGIWVTGYRMGNRIGVMLSGREEPLRAAWSHLSDHLEKVLSVLPEQTKAGRGPTGTEATFTTSRPNTEFSNDDEKRRWLIDTLNLYVTTFRPLLKR